MKMTRQNSHRGRPTPDLLQEVISRFGRERCPMRSQAGIRVHDCQATAQRQLGRERPLPIVVRSLGFGEIQFCGAEEFDRGTKVTITFRCPGIAIQRWHCEIVQTEEFTDTERHIVARFRSTQQTT